jgi:DNA-binding MarR family transcriptional regulator
MSARLHLAVWERLPFGGSRMHAMLALAYSATEAGAVAMGTGELARAARVGRRTAKRAVAALLAEGWILKSRGGGPGIVNAYLINRRKLGI